MGCYCGSCLCFPDCNTIGGNKINVLPYGCRPRNGNSSAACVLTNVNFFLFGVHIIKLSSALLSMSFASDIVVKYLLTMGYWG